MNRSEKDICNQKAGKNKEKVHAKPSKKEIINKSEIMINDYQQDSNTSQTVQCRVMLPVLVKSVHYEESKGLSRSGIKGNFLILFRVICFKSNISENSFLHSI